MIEALACGMLFVVLYGVWQLSKLIKILVTKIISIWIKKLKYKSRV